MEISKSSEIKKKKKFKLGILALVWVGGRNQRGSLTLKTQKVKSAIKESQRQDLEVVKETVPLTMGDRWK